MASGLESHCDTTLLYSDLDDLDGRGGLCSKVDPMTLPIRLRSVSLSPLEEGHV